MQTLVVIPVQPREMTSTRNGTFINGISHRDHCRKFKKAATILNSLKKFVVKTNLLNSLKKFVVKTNPTNTLYSTSSLPSMNHLQVAPQTAHRRIVSARPLPAIPMSSTLSKTPRDLHKRRPTVGRRALPLDLQQMEDQKNRISAVVAIERQLKMEFSGMVSMLDMYATASNPRIAHLVATKISNIDDQILALKVSKKKFNIQSTIQAIVSSSEADSRSVSEDCFKIEAINLSEPPMMSAGLAA